MCCNCSAPVPRSTPQQQPHHLQQPENSGSRQEEQPLIDKSKDNDNQQDEQPTTTTVDKDKAKYNKVHYRLREAPPPVNVTWEQLHQSGNDAEM